MKRTYPAILLAVILMLPICGAAVKVNQQDSSPAVAAEFVHGSVPAQAATLDGMISPINALVMCMVERDLTYDESSDVFVWSSLYYMLSLYGQMDDRAQHTDDTLILPAETVQDYAAALFTDYAGLPALPAELDDRIRYDKTADCYLLARGDAGLTETVFYGWKMLPDGNRAVSGAMVALENGKQLVPFEVVLRENDSMFGFAICKLDIL